MTVTFKKKAKSNNTLPNSTTLQMAKRTLITPIESGKRQKMPFLSLFQADGTRLTDPIPPPNHLSSAACQTISPPQPAKPSLLRSLPTP
jgi:hypothetical protein